MVKKFSFLYFCCHIGATSSYSQDHYIPEHTSKYLPTIFLCTDTELTSRNEPKGKYFLLDNQKDQSFKPIKCQDGSTSWKPMQIKIRGHSSRRYAKKQYQFSQIDSKGEKLSESFLGFSPSEEWVFNAPYTDKAFMRNALMYRLGQEIGSNHSKWFAPETKYAEIWLNDDFLGLFVISPKIERGKYQVNLPKTELDKPHTASFLGELTFNRGTYRTRYGTQIDLQYPGTKKFKEWKEKDKEKARKVKKKIIGDIENFEKALHDDYFTNPEVGYRQYIEVDTFVDYLILQEVAKNFDAYRRSAFFYKAHNGKIHMGPLWDFNIALGNLRVFDFHKPKGWVYEFHFVFTRQSFWFQRLLQDTYFRDKVIERYKELRQKDGLLCDGHIEDIIDSFAYEIGDSANRDTIRWAGTHKLIERVFVRTKDKAHTLPGHVAILKKWMFSRLKWLDAHIDHIGQD